MATVHKPVFTNAQEMAQAKPETFHAPGAAEIAKVKVGDLVKVCCNNERFWVIVRKKVTEPVSLWGYFEGEVNNNLVHNNFAVGALVAFNGCHIYDTWDYASKMYV